MHADALLLLAQDFPECTFVLKSAADGSIPVPFMHNSIVHSALKALCCLASESTVAVKFQVCTFCKSPVAFAMIWDCLFRKNCLWGMACAWIAHASFTACAACVRLFGHVLAPGIPLHAVILACHTQMQHWAWDA